MAALAALGSVAACGPSAEANGATPGSEEEAPAPTRVIDVETLVLEPREFVEYVSVTGDVAADREVVVASEESGVIRAVFAEKGARVTAGQQIARIDDTVLAAQYAQAKAEAELAAETWERQRRLWEVDSIGSEIAYLRAKYGAETAAASARSLEARLDRTVIRAPIAGTLDDRMVEVGSTVMPGSPVARIVDADPLKVKAGIPERYAGDFRTGGTALLAFDHLPDRQLTGRLTFVGTAVDDQNRTFPVEIAIDDAGGMLKPGMVARVQAPRRTLDAALTVPRDAVLRSATGYVVYVVREEGGRSVVRSVPVTTGAGAGGRVVLDSGVQAGDRVVVVGQQRLADGDVVRPIDRTGGA
ncbi:MAG TPA: efflux RND transporter periplasmic adaptor subunit [Gemmatimonadaceae bacterium]